MQFFRIQLQKSLPAFDELNAEMEYYSAIMIKFQPAQIHVAVVVASTP